MARKPATPAQAPSPAPAEGRKTAPTEAAGAPAASPPRKARGKAKAAQAPSAGPRKPSGLGGDQLAPFTPPAWPADKVGRGKIADLVPSARNARTHSPEQVEQIARSIETFGWTMPVLVDEAGGIIAGHGRVLAAQRLGIEEAPIIVARGWSDEMKRAYMLADNQLPMNAGWDPAILRTELMFLQGAEVDLKLLGFDDMQLVSFMAGPAREADPDLSPDLRKDAISKPGDLWIMGKHRLLCGDSTKAADVTRALDGAKPVLMVTDPPYGVSYDPLWREGLSADMKGATVRVEKAGKVVNRFRANATGAVLNDDRADWTEAWRLFPGDVAYVWHGGLHAGEVEANLKAAGFDIRAQIIWAKQNQVFSRGDYHWKHEPCWYAVRQGRPGRWAGDRKQTTVWDIANHNPMGGNRDEEQTGHGTQKPVECMRRPIQNSSRPGDVIYEPFAGSGTTIIAAEMMSRGCRAVELEPAYVDMCVRRWQAYSGAKATLTGSGRTFSEIAVERTGKKEGGDDAKGDSGKSVSSGKRAARAGRAVA